MGASATVRAGVSLRLAGEYGRAKASGALIDGMDRVQGQWLIGKVMGERYNVGRQGCCQNVPWYAWTRGEQPLCCHHINTYIVLCLFVLYITKDFTLFIYLKSLVM
jgi:hypothetical protein